MAKLYPECLSESVLKDPKRGAERKFYAAAAGLSNQFTVFYSVAWQAVDRRAGARDGGARDGGAIPGGADFVIAHPDLGLLVVEVKGGGVGFEAGRGEWYSTGAGDARHAIKDPAEQARSSKHELFKKLKNLPGWDERWLNIAHAVAFPDIYWDSKASQPGLPAEIVLDAGTLPDLEQAVVRAFRHYAGGRSGGLGSDRLELVEKLLARSFQIKTPLGVELVFEDERLVELTERQMMILDFLGNRRRAAIKGCAGSGKAMLALEKAGRLAEQGCAVLLTCFNAALANYLSKRAPQGVPVCNFHGLCRRMADEAGVLIEPVQNQAEFFESALTDDRRQTTDDGRQTTDDGRQTTDDRSSRRAWPSPTSRYAISQRSCATTCR